MHAQLVAEIAHPRSWRRPARFALVLLIALSAGCTKLVYNRLDTLAGWFLEGLVSLDESQRSDMRTLLEQTLQWHRESELTRYVSFVRELAEAAEQASDRSVYERAEKQVEQFGVTVVAKTAPEATRLLMSLTPAQIRELQQGLDEKSVERSAKGRQAIARGMWHEQREKDFQRQLKRWTGTVTAEQKLLVQETAAQLEPTSNDWLASQRRWRQAVRHALEERSRSPGVTQKRILQLLHDPGSEWTAEYRSKSERNRQRLLSLLLSLDASLTGPQREQLQRELLRLAEQLEALKEDGT
jgi:hypothetical protein